MSGSFLELWFLVYDLSWFLRIINVYQCLFTLLDTFYIDFLKKTLMDDFK